MDKEILTTFEAAKYCHVHPGTIKNWIKNENLKAFKTPGGHRRIYRRDLDEFLKVNNIPIIYESKTQRKRVLIIDEDYQVREMITRVLLRRTEMFEVAAAGNGFEGGELLVSFKPDLVILDQQMLGLNAEEICRRIKTSPYLDDARVLVLDSSPDNRKTAPVNDHGPDLWLTKPVDGEKLSAEILRLLTLRKVR
jgi:excisionase family DNA binding protein